jgi:hypothetical protein
MIFQKTGSESTIMIMVDVYTILIYWDYLQILSLNYSRSLSIIGHTLIVTDKAIVIS